MLKWLRCFFIGHNWRQQGHRIVCHKEINEYGSEISERTRCYLLFFCPKCQQIKEYICKTDYIDDKDEKKE